MLHIQWGNASLTINGAAPVNYFLVGSTPTEETEEGKSVNVKQIIMPNEACDHLCSLVTQIACACAQSITPGQAFTGTRFHSCHDWGLKLVSNTLSFTDVLHDAWPSHWAHTATWWIMLYSLELTQVRHGPAACTYKGGYSNQLYPRTAQLWMLQKWMYISLRKQTSKVVLTAHYQMDSWSSHACQNGPPTHATSTALLRTYTTLYIQCTLPW